MEKFNLAIGGQALIEGVMMRAPHHIVMSVRNPLGTIETKEQNYIPFSKRYTVLNIPIIRGIVNFVEMLVIGMKALNWSSQKALDDGSKGTETTTTVAIVLMLILSLGIVLVIFKYIPFLVTDYLDNHSRLINHNWIIFNLIDGLIKISLFLGYVLVISKFKDIKRVFQYHGAEHKSIFAYEHNAELTPDAVMKYQKEHPRCGTSFILIVFMLSIFVYTLVPRLDSFWTNLGLRISLLPLIAGLAYEILKLAGKYHESGLMKFLSKPGMWFQYITTQEPDHQQLEVAIATLKRTLELEEPIHGDQKHTSLKG